MRAYTFRKGFTNKAGGWQAADWWLTGGWVAAGLQLANGLHATGWLDAGWQAGWRALRMVGTIFFLAGFKISLSCDFRYTI